MTREEKELEATVIVITFYRTLYGLQFFVTVQRLAWLTDGDAITTLGTSEEEKVNGMEGQVMSANLNSDMIFVANSIESL